MLQVTFQAIPYHCEHCSEIPDLCWSGVCFLIPRSVYSESDVFNYSYGILKLGRRGKGKLGCCILQSFWRGTLSFSLWWSCDPHLVLISSWGQRHGVLVCWRNSQKTLASLLPKGEFSGTFWSGCCQHHTQMDTFNLMEYNLSLEESNHRRITLSDYQSPD